MPGPADNTPPCPRCGLAPQVRGCTAEVCKTEEDANLVVWGDRHGKVIPMDEMPRFVHLGTADNIHPPLDGQGLALTLSVIGTSPGTWNGPGAALEGVGAGTEEDDMSNPYPANPPPWRWKPLPMGGELLKDAHGRVLLGRYGGMGVNFATPRVRALTEAAGEMHELLRKFFFAAVSDISARCPACGCVLVHVPNCELGALLARIEARAKGGG